jgi:transcriptional regulator with XRE-family HTH domain
MHDRRRRSLELARFLRERRERITPTRAELRATPRRRVMGLTRKEVAARAGVSLTWYSWLEMGREVRSTPVTLRSIARALQLNSDETAYLLALDADPHAGNALHPTGDVDVPTLSRLVEGYREGPAYVVNRRWNVVASNQLARAIYGFVPSDRIEENVIFRLLHDARLRATHEDPDAMMESVVALVRFNYADDPESPDLAELVAKLSIDPRFSAAWRRYSVRTFVPIRVRVRRNGGFMQFIYAAFSAGSRGHQTLIFHLPADDRTRKSMAQARKDDSR